MSKLIEAENQDGVSACLDGLVSLKIKANVWMEQFYSTQIAHVFKSFEESKKEIGLLGQAQGRGGRLRICAGTLNPEYYSSPEFIKQVRQIARSGGLVDIVFGPSMHVENGPLLAAAKQTPNIRFFVRDEYEEGHFKIVECADGGRIALIDSAHAIQRAEGPEKSALLIRGYDAVIDELTNRLYEMQCKSHQVKPKRILEETCFFIPRNGHWHWYNEFRGFITRNAKGEISHVNERQLRQLKQTYQNG